jgi:probable selenium-dependent hydroxylase accessory protein YqeC
VCLVGAGGKKTTLYRLAALHPGRIGITATVHTLPVPDSLAAERMVEPLSLLITQVPDAATRTRVVAFAQPSQKHGRLAGLPPAEASRIHREAGFDVTFIKADGARTRWVKAPAEDEPQLPEDATTVIPVVSAQAIGQPLTEQIAHRVERITAVTGANPGEPLTCEHIARLLAHPEGALKATGNATVVPLINMVDDPERAALARETAEMALGFTRRFDRVVLARMLSAEPVFEVVWR